jgi:class 3 adenylate cyclase
MSYQSVPKYYGLRTFLLATLIYYLLVMPFISILFLKYAPQLIEKGQLKSSAGINSDVVPPRYNAIPISDSLIRLGADSSSLRINLFTGTIDTVNRLPADSVGLNLFFKTPSGPGQAEEKSPLTKTFQLLFRLLIISFAAGFLFNLPYKRYFRRKRRNLRISKKLFTFCKKYLLYTPYINSGILALAFIITTGYMIYTVSKPSLFSDDAFRHIYRQFFYVSMISSLLAVLFVYFWQKHRVHIKYLEHLYTADELRKRIFSLKSGKIRNRFIFSSTVTTLLPLLIVILYLFISLTPVSDLGNLTQDQIKILLGDYTKIFGLPQTIEPESIYRSLFYVNAIDNISMFVGISAGIFISLIYIFFFVRWTTQDIVSPVKELLYNMKLTGEGSMNNFTIVRTNDEIGQLTEGYNEMSQKIKDYIHNISRMNEAYSRFVPKQFLDFLGKEAFVDIKLGDQVQREMTVLFTDIRSFTAISEEMTPKENFDFLNHYLGYMEPVIRNNSGFIDKFIGDSIMALFPDNPGDAINAAIEMRIKLTQFNQVMGQFGKPEIDSGIGIHIGLLMLGVVGGEGRMDGTVISDAVNLASRLEGLTRMYGCSIIISEDTLIKLDDPSAYNYRFLDIVKVKGKKEAVYIFEIIDGEPEDIKRLKIITKTQFAKGISLYKNKQFHEALQEFTDVKEIDMHDRAAALYINRCEKIIHTGLPEDWDGVLILDTKY